MAKKKGKRGNKNNDSDNDQPKKEEPKNESGGLSRKEKRQQKLNKKQNTQPQKKEEEDFVLIDNDENESIEEVKEEIAPRKKLSKKQMQKLKKKGNAFDESEDENSDEDVESSEEEVKPKKQNKKQQKKGFQSLDLSDESEEEIPKPTKKQNKKNKKKGFQALDLSDSDSDSEEEEIIPKPSKKQAKKKQQKNKKKGFQALDLSDDESEEEEEIPQPTKKQSKKQQKNKKKGFQALDLSDDESESEEEEIPQPAKKKGFQALDLSDSESEEEEEIKPAKKQNKKQGFQALDFSDSESEEDVKPKSSGFAVLDDSSSEEEEPAPKKQPKKKEKKDKKKKSKKEVSESESEEEIPKKTAFSALLDSDDEDSDEDVTKTKMVDDDDGKKKKKKESKEKKAARKEAKRLEKEARKAEKEARKAEKEARKAEKEKKRAEKEARKAEKEARKAEKEARKAEKKKDEMEVEEKKDKVEDEINTTPTPPTETIKEVTKDLQNLSLQKEEKPKTKLEKTQTSLKSKRKKSKLELQIEAAMEKRAKEEEAEKLKKAKKEALLRGDVEELVTVKKKKEKKEEEKKIKEIKVVLSEDEESMDEFVGAPDDNVWSDKSHALKESEKIKKDDDKLTHGPDGKKLSNKERKKLLKAKEAALRQAEYEAKALKASAEGAQFACSQTAVNENDPQWQNALDIKIPSFSISVAGKILFKDSELNISYGRRYGVVGPNGKGKSTMLKMIASGDMKLPPRIDFLYVEQEVVADDTPAIQAVLKADKERWNLLEEEKELTKKVDNGDEDPEVINRLQEVYERLQGMGAEAAESKARRILHGLGFSLDKQDKATKLFSGGWRMRISLARALFMEPTLLMLDEPTNHLDLNAVIWLDNYLTTWKKTLLVVSHDQDFLNSVCQEILHIEDLKVVSYKGNYDTFKRSEADKRKQLEKDWEKQQKRLRELKRGGQSKAKAAETIKKSSSKKGNKQNVDAIATGQMSATNMELIKRPKDYVVKLFFPEVPVLSRPVLEVHDVHFRYSRKHPVIFNRVDFGIDMDSRICVVGPNGAGKSTLLKLLTGEIEATKGDVRRNPRLRLGTYNQHFVDRLPMAQSPVEYLRNRYQDETYQTIRNNLGKFGLEGHAHEVAMRDLSGGQKARVVFVDLSLQQPHLLLLDEPTNNLDIETIDALIDAVNEFNGGIVIVTHDQRLIEECDCELWVVEKMGVTSWTAGFEDYKEAILKEMEDEIARDQEIRRQKLEAAALARQEKLDRLASKKR